MTVSSLETPQKEQLLNHNTKTSLRPLGVPNHTTTLNHSHFLAVNKVRMESLSVSLEICLWSPALKPDYHNFFARRSPPILGAKFNHLKFASSTLSRMVLIPTFCPISLLDHSVNYITNWQTNTFRNSDLAIPIFNKPLIYWSNHQSLCV